MAEKSGMECYKHEGRKVVGTCPQCGKFMCKECTEKYESHLCEDCEAKAQEKVQKQLAAKKAQLQQLTKDNKNQALKDLIGGAVLSLIFAIIGFAVGGDSGTGLTTAYMFAGFPWGYKFISKIMDDGVMFFAALGNFWLVALIIKIGLGALIGAIIWPFIIGFRVYKFVKANNADKDAKNV